MGEIGTVIATYVPGPLETLVVLPALGHQWYMRKNGKRGGMVILIKGR